MSAASFNLKAYLNSSQAGRLALIEFLFAGVAGECGSLLIGKGNHVAAQLLYLISLAAIVFFVTHSVKVLKRRGWDAWFTLLAVLLIYLVAQTLAGLLVSIYPALKGWSLERITHWLDNSMGAQFAFVILTAFLSLGAILAYLKHFRISRAQIGLRRPRWSDLGYGLAALPVYLIAYLIVVGVISQLKPSLDINQVQQLGFNDVQGALSLLLAFISLVVLPPIIEETMVRGLLFSGLKKAMPWVYAGLLSSVLFALAHLPEGGASGPLYIAAIDTFVLGLVLVYLRQKTSGLYASMTLHALKNGIAFLALFVWHVR